MWDSNFRLLLGHLTIKLSEENLLTYVRTRVRRMIPDFSYTNVYLQNCYSVEGLSNVRTMVFLRMLRSCLSKKCQ